MSAVTGPARSLGWRLVTTAAVALVMVAGFIGGSAFAAGSVPTWQSVGALWLLWFGFQATCLLLGSCWDWIGLKFRKPALYLIRRWLRLRVHLRRRWIGDRSREDYRTAEAAMIWPAMVVVGLIICLTTFGMTLALIVGAVTLLMVFIVTPYYRDAPEKPMSSIVFAAIFSCAMGYVMAMPVTY